MGVVTDVYDAEPLVVSLGPLVVVVLWLCAVAGLIQLVDGYVGTQLNNVRTTWGPIAIGALRFALLRGSSSARPESRLSVHKAPLRNLAGAQEPLWANSGNLDGGAWAWGLTAGEYSGAVVRLLTVPDSAVPCGLDGSSRELFVGGLELLHPSRASPMPGTRCSRPTLADQNSLADLAAQTGAQPVTVTEAARGAEVVIVAVPEGVVTKLPPGLFHGLPDNVVIVDAGNYYPRERDGRTNFAESTISFDALR